MCAWMVASLHNLPLHAGGFKVGRHRFEFGHMDSNFCIYFVAEGAPGHPMDEELIPQVNVTSRRMGPLHCTVPNPRKVVNSDSFDFAW